MKYQWIKNEVGKWLLSIYYYYLSLLTPKALKLDKSLFIFKNLNKILELTQNVNTFWNLNINYVHLQVPILHVECEFVICLL